MTEERLIITFKTTTAALVWERVCKAENLPGRLIPVPSQIKSGCGLAWLSIVTQKERLLQGVAEFELQYDQLVEVEAIRDF